MILFKRVFARILLLAMMACILAGCVAPNTQDGGNADEPDVLLGITEDTIWVGNTVGSTGTLASVGGPFNLGIEAAFAAYNAAGGYNGKKIALKHYDDGGVATNSVKLMDKLIHEDEVFAIVGNMTANCVKANLPIIKEAKVPMVYAAVSNQEVRNGNAAGADRGIYLIQPLDVTEYSILLLSAFAPADKGGLAGTKVGVLSSADESSQSILKGIKAEAENLPADRKNAIIYQNVTSGDYSAAITAFKASGCDVIIVTVTGADYTAALTAMSNANLSVPVLTVHSNGAAMLNDAATTMLKTEYENILKNIPIFTQSWLDIFSATYVYNQQTPLAAAYEALYTGMDVPYTGVVGFNEGYWTVAENIFNYCVSTDRADVALAMSCDSYALAGYIAGDLFCQGMEALEKSGKALSRANFIDIMESREFKIALSGSISFANAAGTRVTSFSLTSTCDIFHADAAVGGGVYHQALHAPVHTLTSIEEYRALLNG